MGKTMHHCLLKSKGNCRCTKNKWQCKKHQDYCKRHGIPYIKSKYLSSNQVYVKKMYGRVCRMHRRRTGQTDRSYGIRWRERNTEKGQRCGTKWGNRGRCRTYNIGVKDLASAYVLCPRLAECGGLSIYRQNRGLWNNEGIVSGVVTPVWKQIRTED